MKTLIIYLSILSAAMGMTLTNKEGKSIEVENLSYNGKLLSGKLNGRNISFDPELLNKESWAQVKEELIYSSPVSVRFQKTESKKDYEGYDIDIGSTAPAEREIAIHYFIIGGASYLTYSKKVQLKRGYEESLKIKRTKTTSADGISYCSASVGGETKQFIASRLELLVVVTSGKGKILGESFNTSGGREVFEKIKKGEIKLD